MLSNQYFIQETIFANKELWGQYLSFSLLWPQY